MGLFKCCACFVDVIQSLEQKFLQKLRSSLQTKDQNFSPDLSIAIMSTFLLTSLSATLILSTLCKFPLKTQDESTEASEDLI